MVWHAVWLNFTHRRAEMVIGRAVPGGYVRNDGVEENDGVNGPVERLRYAELLALADVRHETGHPVATE